MYTWGLSLFYPGFETWFSRKPSTVDVNDGTQQNTSHIKIKNGAALKKAGRCCDVVMCGLLYASSAPHEHGNQGHGNQGHGSLYMLSAPHEHGNQGHGNQDHGVVYCTRRVCPTSTFPVGLSHARWHRASCHRALAWRGPCRSAKQPIPQPMNKNKCKCKLILNRA